MLIRGRRGEARGETGAPLQCYRAHTSVRCCLLSAQQWGRRTLKTLSLTPAAPSLLHPPPPPPTSARPLTCFLLCCGFLLVTVAAAHPLSLCVFTAHLSPSAFLSNLVLVSHHRHHPTRHPASHHLCSCIKVSQRSPASSKLTFPPFKSSSSRVKLRKIKRHLPFYILFICRFIAVSTCRAEVSSLTEG